MTEEKVVGIMSTDIKKPPVAPKPKIVESQKAFPPPVAPKPDIVLSHTAPALKKAKPAVAPKPLFSKSACVPETKPVILKNASRIFPDEKTKLSEDLGLLNSKNGLQTELNKLNSNYIITTCTCTVDCRSKCKHTENCKTDFVIDQLEKLEALQNGRLDGVQVSPAPRARTKHDTSHEKIGSKSQVVLNASLLEHKLKNVLVQAVSPNNHHLKFKSQERATAQKCKAGNLDLDQTSNAGGSAAELGEKCSNSEESQRETGGLDSHSTITLSNEPQSQNIPGPMESFVSSTKGTCKPNNESSVSHNTFISSPAPKKPLPIPMPRKSKKSGLVRQDCVESNVHSVDGHIEMLNMEPEGVCLKSSPFKSPKVCIHTQSVSYSRNLSESHENAGSSQGCDTGENLEIPLPVSGSFLAGELSKTPHFCGDVSGEMEMGEQSKSTAGLESENGEKSAKGVVSSVEKTSVAEVDFKSEKSPKVAPKKPQRHSLSASGLLKKELLEELTVRSPCAEDVESGVPDGDCPQTEELGPSAESDRKRELPAEKPVWKLPRPIVPLFGKPEALKTGRQSVMHSKVPTLCLGKPRAKSFSSADLERTEGLSKDGQKRSSFRKLLELKLSVKKLPRFLAKSSQSLDCTSVTTDPPAYGEWSSSKENSPVLPKHGFVTNGQCETPISVNSKLDLADEPKASCSKSPEEGSLYCTSFPKQDCAVEYENLPLYEEIPEYMNLPFLMASGLRNSESPAFGWQNSSSVEDEEADLYEVQEPYLPYQKYRTHMRTNTYERPSLDQDLGLENEHSEEEEVVNSSDEDDNSSSSSKGDLNLSGDRQHDGGVKQTKVVHIAKEIMSSEKVFVDVLKLLHIDFRDAVAKASRQTGKAVIEERILNQILYYLPQLYELNRDLLRELEERVAHWNDHQRIADIFVKKGPYLKMYSTYIREFNKNVALLDEQCKKNLGFASVVKEFEMSPRCASLALKHYLLKPVQRIPQYQLLLTDYLKNLSEDSFDYKDTQAALGIVIEVANHANDIMKQGDNFQKLMQIQYSLNGHHEIVQPGRVFLKEGTLMKLSRKVMQPRTFFLFNDTLLYTTPVQSGMYKLNSMLSLAGMKVSKPTQEAYQNELNIESVERSFILSASSATERDEWLEAISKAIDDYTRKKISFFNSKSLEETDSAQVDSGAPLGSKAPIWIPDLRATMCMICTCEFTLTWRRHHCRACGKVVCQSCSLNKHRLEYLKNQPARVCDQCFSKLQQHNNQALPTGFSPTCKTSPGAFSSVLISIPSGRKQKKIPAALKEVTANTENSSISGYLYRSKGHKKQWKRLWFVIKNKVLYTYAASEDVAALESQPLLGFHLREEQSGHKLRFKLYHKNTLFYIFKADDFQTAQKWIEAFQAATIL
ncbi:FYVE, RhoGEF and PH domain-containing protein 6 [Lepisosteus oculatus]|uniref:FYVE, RhoGEF and PH domain-containing protein 6 n=1 Tax=Lepisosteus oculatus TaxID=7918 RepID=UPI0037122C38